MWQPGQSGNPNGKPAKKPFLDQIDRLCKQEDYARLRKAAEKLLDLAAEGEPWAVQMVADRMDGKPAQAIANDNDQPFVVELVKRVIVRAADGNA